MASREDVGSWLEGGPGGGGGRPGEGLGLPASGPGSPARLGRRLAALAVDWLACLLVSAAFFPSAAATGLALQRGEPLATLAVFAVENVLLVGTLGTTLGHRLLGLRVVPAPERASAASGPVAGVGLLRALVRTVLLCLVVPAVVRDGDGRGLHDTAAGTVIVRR
ncbi:RDD family protein [Cellulomonas marina]|uniref:Uncharacterized membrane protein YckC, RDD family n=1 Tax=Cellulomonas marina TaxID=988821 RepID=A0A1I0VYP6_9CELL|nr:RDD family protein [Cellulomonas marina]GIG27457.1 RDD family protein [Cellulomonas marina]SFA81549.1 Uncharacterized membrane protein YckC, RDD family [Cellulomonas marina]